MHLNRGSPHAGRAGGGSTGSGACIALNRIYLELYLIKEDVTDAQKGSRAKQYFVPHLPRVASHDSRATAACMVNVYSGSMCATPL